MDTQINSSAWPADGSSAELPLSGAEAVAEIGEPSESEAIGSGEADWRMEIIRRAEAEGMADIYPDFDPDEALAHPELGAWLRGEHTPGLRALYEATHMEDIVEARVRARLDAAVAEALAVALPEAVSAAVAESEERLLGHIRARGQRPAENGTSASVGIRMHPAVDRLTRRERAMLAARAERGENVRL